MARGGEAIRRAAPATARTIEPGDYDRPVEQAIFEAGEQRHRPLPDVRVPRDRDPARREPMPRAQQEAIAWETLSNQAQQQAIDAFTGAFEHEMAAADDLRTRVPGEPRLRPTPDGSARPLTQGTAPKTRTSAELRPPRCPRLSAALWSTADNLGKGARSPLRPIRGADDRCGGHGWSSAPGFEGGARERSLPADAGAGAADGPLRGCERGLPVDGARRAARRPQRDGPADGRRRGASCSPTSSARGRRRVRSRRRRR